MAEVNKGVRELMESDLIPDDDYNFVVNAVRDAGTWEVADLGFDSPDDPELVGRRLSYFLGQPSTESWRGLTDLLKSAKLMDVPEDEATGKRDTKIGLIGVKFPGRVRRRDGNRGPENVVYPIIDPDWVSQHLKDGSGGGTEETKPRRRRRRRSA